MIKVW